MTTVSLGCFNFNTSELEAFHQKSEKRLHVDMAATKFLEQPSLESVAEYSLAVFQWGKGMRVYAKIDKPDWERHALEWLTKIPNLSDREAIDAGDYKGVKVSFLSKHLRLLYPDRFVTLDSVIEEKLGYARNTAGYMLFLADLHGLKDKYRLQCSIGDLEEAIYRSVKTSK